VNRRKHHAHEAESIGQQGMAHVTRALVMGDQRHDQGERSAYKSDSDTGEKTGQKGHEQNEQDRRNAVAAHFGMYFDHSLAFDHNPLKSHDTQDEKEHRRDSRV